MTNYNPQYNYQTEILREHQEQKLTRDAAIELHTRLTDALTVLWPEQMDRAIELIDSLFDLEDSPNRLEHLTCMISAWEILHSPTTQHKF